MHALTHGLLGELLFGSLLFGGFFYLGFFRDRSGDETPPQILSLHPARGDVESEAGSGRRGSRARPFGGEEEARRPTLSHVRLVEPPFDQDID